MNNIFLSEILVEILRTLFIVFAPGHGLHMNSSEDVLIFLKHQERKEFPLQQNKHRN